MLSAFQKKDPSEALKKGAEIVTPTIDYFENVFLKSTDYLNSTKPTIAGMILINHSLIYFY